MNGLSIKLKKLLNYKLEKSKFIVICFFYHLIFKIFIYKIEVFNMDEIILEKAISFSTNIESLQNLSIKDSIDYKLLDDGCSVIGVIKLSGMAKTLKGLEPFDENIDIDIFAPFDQVIDKSKFSLKVQNYSYQIMRNTAVFKINLQVTGFRKIKEEHHSYEGEAFNLTNEIDDILEETPISYDDELLEEFKEMATQDENKKIDEELKNDMNSENEIQDLEQMQDDIKKDESTKDEDSIPVSITKPIQNQPIKENRITSWASDLFKEKESYVTFVKIHRKDQDDEQ